MEYIIGLLQHTEGIEPMIFLVSFFSILLRIIRYFAEFECHCTHRVMEPDFIELLDDNHIWLGLGSEPSSQIPFWVNFG